MAIQGHVFWNQRKANEGLHICCLIPLALSPKVRKKAAKALKIAVVDNPIIVGRPLQGTHVNIHYQKLESLAYILAADSTVLCSFKFLWWAKECVLAIQGHLRSLILAPIERAYATFYWSLIVTLVLPCTISETWRLIGWKLQIFPTPLSFYALARGEPFQNSGCTVNPENYSPFAIHLWRFRDPSLRCFDSVPACDRRTDRQTNIPTVGNTELCICWHFVKTAVMYWLLVKSDTEKFIVKTSIFCVLSCSILSIWVFSVWFSSICCIRATAFFSSSDSFSFSCCRMSFSSQASISTSISVLRL